MNYQNDDLRIKEIKELLPPVALLEKFPATENAANTVAHARKAIHKILKGNDDRLLVVIGPCSIHDPVAAKEYATRLLALREELKDELEIVMRVYFEKPRTTVGWKGLINDPHMDNSFQINDGLRIARKLLLDINDSGLPAAGEFLDMITPQYLADLMSWGAIGARSIAASSPSTARASVRAMITKSGSVFASTAARIRSTISSFETIALFGR